MREEALLLKSPGANGGHTATLLQFFGVPSRALSLAEFLCERAEWQGSKAKLFCSTGALLNLLIHLEGRSDGIQFWREQIHSVFVHAEDDSELLQKLLGKLNGNNAMVVGGINCDGKEVVISDNEMCGVMAGVRIAASRSGTEDSFAIKNATADNILSIEGGATFLKFYHHSVPVFLSTCRRVVDLNARLATGIFDIRDHALSAVPIVLYVKWAFAKACWNAPENNACVIIDDPLLKPEYGFVDFRHLLSLMKRHRFSTNIGFIPWNWRRSSPEVVRMFTENTGLYSISVHGCDHTRGEFGLNDRHRLFWKARLALDRMTRHQSNTGISHDRVMVFPQGVFSEAAISALKHAEYIAAANNDTISCDASPRAITISEVWNIALMSYSDFPIFTRRYPWEGVENFAFDILLGKPAIVVIHHDFCSDQGVRLVEFIERLNALKCSLSWRSLGELVKRSCRQSESPLGIVEVEMCGTELRLENTSGKTANYVIKRRESAPALVKNIEAGARDITWNYKDSQVQFELELKPQETTTIRVRYHAVAGSEPCADKMGYKLHTMMRRFLSEARDNYFLRYGSGFWSRFFKVN